MTNQVSDIPRTSRNKVLIGVISAAIAAVVLQQFAKRAQDARRASVVQRQWNDSEWKTQSIGELTLTSPFELTPTEKYLDQLPSEVKDMIVAAEMSSALLTGGSIVVTHTEYREELEVDVEGAVAGAIRHCAEAAGDSDPKFKIIATQSTGTPASAEGAVEQILWRRGSYQGKPRGNPLWVDAVGLQRRQEIWVVVVASQFETTEAAVERLLKSVRVGNETKP